MDGQTPLVYSRRAGSRLDQFPADGRTAPAKDGLAAQFMCENARAATWHCKLRVDVGGESAFRDREDDSIGAFYWSDEGFGYAIGANADRALWLRLRSPAGRPRRMVPEPSFRRHQGRPAGFDHGSLAAHENFTSFTVSNDPPSFSLSALRQLHW